MKTEIEQIARKFFDALIKKFFKKKYTLEELKKLIKKELGEYNSKILEVLSIGIYGELKGFSKDIPNTIPTKIELSEMLYTNSKQVEIDTLRILARYDINKTNIEHLARLLYEGYGFKDEEVLKVKKALPNYIRKYIAKKKNKKELLRQVNKIKTKNLQLAYKQIATATTDEAIKKALEIATYEKSRYYATRIAQTEQQRAITLSNAKEYLEDDNIEFVKFTMNSKHPMMDICDYYANLDVGYGKGIIPKKDMIALPLHPHCMCKYRPYYKKVIYKTPENIFRAMSKRDKISILGSYDNYLRYEKGEDIEKIFNSNRAKYPITKVIKLL
jgi:hypothetical protein